MARITRRSGDKKQDRSGPGKEGYDVRAVRGVGRGLSDHHVVLCKVRLEGHGLRGER